MDFSLPEDLKLMQQVVRDFAKREIAPLAAELNEQARYPHQTLAHMADLGLLGIMTPEAYGGSGLGCLAFVTLLEEISAADASHGTIMSVTNGLPQTILYRHGTQTQREQWLTKLASGQWIGAFCLSEPHCGSDAAALQTRATPVPDGYILQGTKAWITGGGEASLYLVLAKTNPELGARGISCFAIEKGTPGLSFGPPEHKLGLHASVTTTMTLTDCFVPASARIGPEGQGFVMAMSALDEGRIGIAAQAVGISRAAFDAAWAYAQERQAFGKAIRHFQAVGFKLADMATRISAARLMVQRAAWLKDQGHNITQEASMAKLFASETSAFVTHQAIQVLGGYGYSRDYPVERYFRDARVTEIYEGSSEVQRLVIARQLFKRVAEAEMAMSG